MKVTLLGYDQVPQSNQGIKHLQNDHYNHKISNVAELLTESTSALNENFNLVHLYFVLYCKNKSNHVKFRC